MLRYVLRRFLLLIPMVLAASVIIFLMLRLGTGDPALDYLRLSNLPPTPEMLASTRTMLGLDQPLYVQYGTWLWKALHLDFGISFASQRPVLDDMLNFLPATLELAGAALVLICSLPYRSVSGRRATATDCRISPYVSSRFLACRCLTSGWRFYW